MKTLCVSLETAKSLKAAGWTKPKVGEIWEVYGPYKTHLVQIGANGSCYLLDTTNSVMVLGSRVYLDGPCIWSIRRIQEAK